MAKYMDFLFDYFIVFELREPLDLPLSLIRIAQSVVQSALRSNFAVELADRTCR